MGLAGGEETSSDEEDGSNENEESEDKREAETEESEEESVVASLGRNMGRFSLGECFCPMYPLLLSF